MGCTCRQKMVGHWCVCAKWLLSCLTLCDLVDCQAPLSMGFSKQEYWSGFPCPPPGALPDSGIEPASLVSPALAGGFFITCATFTGIGEWEPRTLHTFLQPLSMCSSSAVLRWSLPWCSGMSRSSLCTPTASGSCLYYRTRPTVFYLFA